VTEAVEERADEWGEEDERRHREQEEEGHPPPRLVGREREHRARERDREGGVPGDVDGVQLGEPGQSGVGGAVGVREAAEPPTGRGTSPADEPDAGPAAATHGTARPGHALSGAGSCGRLGRRHDLSILPRPDARSRERRGLVGASGPGVRAGERLRRGMGPTAARRGWLTGADEPRGRRDTR
jgi:hypothetical protein